MIDVGSDRAFAARIAYLRRKADFHFERSKEHYRRWRLKAKYDPNQPRVPKGQPDGGQWTKIGGDADANSGPGGRLKDEPDRAEPAQGRRRDRGRENDFYLNAHIRRNHIGLSDGELVKRIEQSITRTQFVEVGRDRHGSFNSAENAHDLIRRTLDSNSEAVERVREGRSREEFVTRRFGFATGREAVMEPIGSPIRLRNTYEVGVVIRHDPNEGYRVVTAFPRNYNPRIGR
jgi:hypothetical protein